MPIRNRKKTSVLSNGSRKRTAKRVARRRPLVMVLALMAGAAVAAWLKSRSEQGPEQPYEGQDLVEHASMSSFPASDAPAY